MTVPTNESEKSEMQKVWERDHPQQPVAGTDKVVVKEYPRGSIPVIRELHVPADQAWLKYTLDQQTKVLRSINTAVSILAILAVIGVILASCSALVGG